MLKTFSKRELYEIRESYRMIYEDASSKNRHYGREYTRKNAGDLLGRTLDDGRTLTEWDIEKDIAGACKNAMEMAKSKFMLGATRIYLDAARRNPHDATRILNRLNQIIKIIASGHENEYDRNLNGMTFDDLEDRFGEAVYVEQEKDKEELGRNSYKKNSEYDIARINSFGEATKYSRYTDWCVTHSENMFDTYTGGTALFYFCLKKGFESTPRQRGEGCPLDEYGLSMIAVLVNEDGSLKHCTCRWNHDNGGNDNIMDTRQLSELLGVNFYDVFKPRSAEEIMAGLRESAVEDEFAERMGWLAVEDEWCVNYVMNVNGYIRRVRKGFECVADGRRLMCVADRELIWYDMETGERVRAPERVEPVTVPSTVFSSWKRISSLTLPYGVTGIESWAFSGCSGLASVTIPDSVRSIDRWAFEDCSSLRSVRIPDGVTSIGENAFSGCSGLTSVTIPDSVTEIAGRTFLGCSGLTSVTIGSGVRDIGFAAFCDCNHLTSVTVGNNVTDIGERAFQGCSGLTSVTIGNGVTSIGGCAFYKCSGLTSLTIPDSVTSTGSYAFKQCNGLTGVTIGSGLMDIWYGAFSDCTGLKSVTIPDNVTSIGEYAFKHCNGLTNVTIGSGVRNIRSFAFYGCIGLKSVTIPDNVTSIGENAFDGCSGLKSVTICNGVMEIREYAFALCSGLTSLTIPNSVTLIGYRTFDGCSNLSNVSLPRRFRNLEMYGIDASRTNVTFT